MKPNQRKLRLRKSTLRDLSAGEASQVVGGYVKRPGDTGDTCTNIVPTCCDCTITEILSICPTCYANTCGC